MGFLTKAAIGMLLFSLVVGFFFGMTGQLNTAYPAANVSTAKFNQTYSQTESLQDTVRDVSSDISSMSTATPAGVFFAGVDIIFGIFKSFVKLTTLMLTIIGNITGLSDFFGIPPIFGGVLMSIFIILIIVYLARIQTKTDA